MRVLHISRTMGQGGAEKVVLGLAQLLVDQGDKAVVASCGGIHEQDLQRMHVHHYRIDDIEKKTPMTIAKTMVMLNHIVRNEKIEVVHSHHRMAALYARLLKVINPELKLIYTAHNVFFI